MEIKDVSDGYARNFLIAKKLAVPADEAAIKLKAQTEKKEKELVVGYQKLAERLKTENLEFQVKTGAKGEVFGSVTAEDIKDALLRQGYGGQNTLTVILKKSLHILGEHKVEVNFGKGIGGEAIVNLVPLH